MSEDNIKNEGLKTVNELEKIIEELKQKLNAFGVGENVTLKETDQLYKEIKSKLNKTRKLSKSLK